MGMAESSRGRRERSPKQEYLDQVLNCVYRCEEEGVVYIGVEVPQVQRTWTL
jgi:hypothetical protein